MAIKGYWRFNGNSNDASGNGNNGTDTAITYSQANGRMNQGAGFNGTTSYISVPNSATLNITTIFTISFWFLDKGNDLVLRSFCMAKGVNETVGWDIAGYSGNLNLRCSTLSSINNQTPNGFCALNKWAFVVITFNASGGSNNLIFYKNGIPSVIFTRTGTLRSSTYPLTIGRSVNNSWYATGNIEQLIIEDMAWSPAKVKNEYARIKGFF